MNRQLTISTGLIQFGDKFLLTRRVDDDPQWHHRWEFPGGKIEPEETPIEALHREIFEETNLTINNPRLLGVYTHFWRVSNGTQQTFILLYHCFADHQNVILQPSESDALIWVEFDEIMKMDNLLDGTLEMLQELFSKEKIDCLAGNVRSWNQI